jgi:hypothetical protein
VVHHQSSSIAIIQLRLVVPFFLSNVSVTPFYFLLSTLYSQPRPLLSNSVRERKKEKSWGATMNGGLFDRNFFPTRFTLMK